MSDKTKEVSMSPAPDSPKAGETAIDNRVKKHSTRRDFITRALVGAVAVTTTAKLAEKTATYISDADNNKKYFKDIAAGDRAMKEREYVVMSVREKKEYLEEILSGYRK